MTSRVAPKHCTLRERLGEVELCPGPECGFWEDGVGCTLELLGLVDLGQEELSRHLLELRLRLEEAKAEAERRSAPHRFSRLRNRGAD